MAERLINKQTVNPEGFSCVTIFFSDIVGFTSISSNCKPLDVVEMLNDLYSAMDGECEIHDVYKVETIGKSCCAIDASCLFYSDTSCNICVAISSCENLS